ncbi:hypothetical protein PAMP_007260 [Pampus punctatissimus]
MEAPLFHPHPIPQSRAHMQHQLFGRPLKSSDEMENIGEKEGVLTEQVAVGENTKPGDSGGEKIEMTRRETSSVTLEAVTHAARSHAHPE